MIHLTISEQDQIATILNRRANEISIFKCNLKDIASVDYALELEITRLRNLANRVNPPLPDEGE